MGNPCVPHTTMPWVSDSSQTQKMKQINSSVSYGEDSTTAQHDNDHKSTEALRLPPERRFLNQCRLV